jgi:small subunit ribosomal protein S20
MPNHKSAWKRMRQNEKRRTRNRAQRSYLRKVIKTYTALEDASAANEQLPGVVSVIDKMVKKGIVHHRKAARIKSRLTRLSHGSS